MKDSSSTLSDVADICSLTGGLVARLPTPDGPGVIEVIAMVAPSSCTAELGVVGAEAAVGGRGYFRGRPLFFLGGMTTAGCWGGAGGRGSAFSPSTLVLNSELSSLLLLSSRGGPAFSLAAPLLAALAGARVSPFCLATGVDRSSAARDFEWRACAMFSMVFTSSATPVSALLLATVAVTWTFCGGALAEAVVEAVDGVLSKPDCTALVFWIGLAAASLAWRTERVVSASLC